MNKYFVTVDDVGTIHWYKDAKMTIRHRVGGPVIEYADGGKEWWLNGDIHRTDGPAAEYADGHKAWWLNDKLHRTDGPAIELANGDTQWFLNGKCLTE